MFIVNLNTVYYTLYFSVDMDLSQTATHYTHCAASGRIIKSKLTANGKSAIVSEKQAKTGEKLIDMKFHFKWKELLDSFLPG